MLQIENPHMSAARSTPHLVSRSIAALPTLYIAHDACAAPRPAFPPALRRSPINGPDPRPLACSPNISAILAKTWERGSSDVIVEGVRERHRGDARGCDVRLARCFCEVARAHEPHLTDRLSQ